MVGVQIAGPFERAAVGLDDAFEIVDRIAKGKVRVGLNAGPLALQHEIGVHPARVEIGELVAVEDVLVPPGDVVDRADPFLGKTPHEIAPACLGENLARQIQDHGDVLSRVRPAKRPILPGAAGQDRHESGVPVFAHRQR